MEEQMPWIWLCVIICSCFVEFITSVQLTAIWMALGGIAAIIAEFCDAPIYLQIIIFLVVTAVAIILTRPLAKKLMKFEKLQQMQICLSENRYSSYADKR